MIYKLQNGGEVALNQQENVRKESPKSAILVKGSTASVPQPLKSYVPPMEKLKKIISKMKNTTERPKAIGVFSFGYNQPTRVVENGGNIA